MKLIETIKQIIKEEVTEPNYLFTKEYIAEDKSVITTYFIKEEGDKIYKVINPMEFIDNDSVWADGYRPYKIKLNEFNLPKSQVQILGEIDGYTIFKIPYWLFKKNRDMNIVRLSMDNKRYKNYHDDEMFKIFDKDTITKILSPLGGDLDKIDTTYEIIKIRSNPKVDSEDPNNRE